MPSPDPSSPPPTVFRPAEPARTEATRETGHRQRQTTNFDLSLDPRYYGLFGPPLRPGDIGSLARYRVIALLGEGGMGMVFRAEDVDLGREVALKVMRPEYAADRPLQQRFLREARHTAGLQHENVVTVYQVGEDSGTLFMALELLQGATLEQKLGVEQISLADALRIGREMACGLAAAHARGLIHRDVKPDNVWIESPHGRAKVLDFGLARPDRDSQILTHAGTVVGTPGYMSPEQSRAETLDERADVFSLGCVIYRMVTGYGPFPCRNFEEMCRAFKDSPPRRMSRLNDEVPPALDDLVAGMIEFDRDNRPASAREVALALAAIERSLGIDVDLRASLFPVPASGPRALPRSAADRLATEKKSLVARVWPRTTWGLVGAGVLAVALIAVLAFGLLH
ncbi:MAG TPA: serine/threonine-protein kinase, partial [Pirellulales bacterium]